MQKLLKVQSSPVHGTGVFAAQDIAAGQCLGTYTGRRYTARQAAARDWDHSLTYVFGLSDGSVIDASEGGNETRHLNHCCAPNVQAQEERGPRRQKTIAFYALRDLQAGEELFIDYALVVDEPQAGEAYRCRCGAPNCRGTLLAPAEG